MAAESDAPSVGKHSDEHLRRFVAARTAGDVGEMRRWWELLVSDFYDRMDGIVALTHRGRLDDDEHEEAVQRALIRFSQGLIETFRGESMGELVNASKTLARYICMDVQDAAQTRREREQRSLDSGWDLDAEDRGTRSWESDEALRRFEQDERGENAGEFLAWAIPRLIPSRRAVIELTFHGSELHEICDELGLTHDNAYQLRSRGYKDLKKLKEQYES